MTEKTGYKAIGALGMLSGAGLIVLAVFVLLTNQVMNISRDFWGNVTSASYSFPNMPYSVVLGILGFILFAVGAVLYARTDQKKKSAKTAPPE